MKGYRKRIAKVFTFTLILFQIFIFVQPLRASEEVNLAAGKVYVKSEEPDVSYSDMNNSETTDGILAKDFTDGFSYGYNIPLNTTKSVDITIDLGYNSTLNHIKVHKWEGAGNYGPDSVTVYTSSNGKNFKEESSSTSPTDIWYDLSFKSTNTRYIRVNFKKYNNGAWGNDWLFIDEIEAFNSPAASGGTSTVKLASNLENIALGKTYTLSLEPSDTYTDNGNSEATDGQLSYDYSDGKSFGYYVPEGTSKTVDVIIDLEKMRDTESVRIHKWEGQQSYFPSSITVSGSKNFKNYSEVGTITSAEGSWYQINFTPDKLRYIKISITKYNDGTWGNDWLFIDEIQVLGESKSKLKK